MPSQKGTLRLHDVFRRTKHGARNFYLNGDLHRVLTVSKAADLLYAWNYPQRKRMTYIYSDVKKHAQRAFDTSEVCIMMDRHYKRIYEYIEKGHIKAPQKMYTLDGRFAESKYQWSEDDVLALHDYMVTVHRGRPRKDGFVRTWNLPSRAELKAMMRNKETLYVKGSDGEFAPIWKEVDWS